MRSVLSKFNIRQLLIHFAAFWLFIYAFQTLAYLYDFNFLYLTTAQADVTAIQRVQFDSSIVELAGYFGCITGYVISCIISIKRGWFWLNPAVIFVLAYIPKLNNLLGWTVLKKVFLLPGSMFSAHRPAYYIINGGIMLIIGCLLFFSKRIKLFIDKGEPKAVIVPKRKTAKVK